MEVQSDSLASCPIAILNTSCGPLHIFDASSLLEIVRALAGQLNAEKSLATAHVPGHQQLLHGFNIHQWADYGHKKAMIASKVCRDNGRLKAAESPRDKSDDAVFVTDPWAGCASLKPLPEGLDSSANAWSKWQSTANELACNPMPKDDVTANASKCKD